MSVWRIVLADDHQVVRTGVRTMLETALPCQVVAEASAGDEAIALAQQVQPDLMVSDIVMPKVSGLEVVRQVRQIAPNTRIVIFSMHADESYLREALRLGATAYVLKESPGSELVASVQQAMAGRRFVSAALSDQIITSYAQPNTGVTFDPYDLLTDREHEVFTLAAQGLTSNEIAERLVVSVRTIDSHRTNMMRKLGLRTVADLVRYAIRRGVIQLDP
ncbi:MAG: response regulator transcription factor [Chloroflexales bacterium]